MWLTVIYIVGGLCLLFVGAEALVRGSSALALRAGVAPLVVGLTVVAFGTSGPELVVSVKASAEGNGAIALGNVFGSNICNILGILGVAALVRPIPVAEIGHLDLAVMAGTAALVLPLMSTGFCLKRWEGALLLAGYAVYTYHLLP